MMTIMELKLAVIILSIICGILAGLFLVYVIWERKELLKEIMMYRRTIQAQNNIRSSCLAAYRAMLQESNKRQYKQYCQIYQYSVKYLTTSFFDTSKTDFDLC